MSPDKEIPHVRSCKVVSQIPNDKKKVLISARDHMGRYAKNRGSWPTTPALVSAVKRGSIVIPSLPGVHGPLPVQAPPSHTPPLHNRKTHTHTKSLIFLISFLRWDRVCNISTKISTLAFPSKTSSHPCTLSFFVDKKKEKRKKTPNKYGYNTRLQKRTFPFPSHRCSQRGFPGPRLPSVKAAAAWRRLNMSFSMRRGN